MTNELRESLEGLLEENHQSMSDGMCPECEAEEYPCDAEGNRIEYNGASEASYFSCDHYDDCPIIAIENILQKSPVYLAGLRSRKG